MNDSTRRALFRALVAVAAATALAARCGPREEPTLCVDMGTVTCCSDTECANGTVGDAIAIHYRLPPDIETGEKATLLVESACGFITREVAFAGTDDVQSAVVTMATPEGAACSLFVTAGVENDSRRLVVVEPNGATECICGTSEPGEGGGGSAPTGDGGGGGDTSGGGGAGGDASGGGGAAGAGGSDGGGGSAGGGGA